MAGITVLVLACGLALNASLFAILDGVLLKPLPFQEPDRIVMAYGSRRSGANFITQPLTAAGVRALRENTALFESVAGFGPGDLHEGELEGDSAAIQHRQVTPELFDVLGVRPVMGRGLVAADVSQGDPRNAIVGFDLWRSRFGQDRSILGKTVSISGRTVRVVGVMRAGFEFPFGTNVWTALVVPPDRERFAYLEAVGRLQPGVSIDTARERFRNLESSVYSAAPRYQLRQLREVLEPKHTLTVVLMFTTALIALAIAWIQAAAGELSAATDQTRAMAIQMCLGASKRRLLRQFATTGAIVSGVALAVAFALAPSVTAVLLRWLPPSATSGHDIAIDFRTFVFGAAMSGIGLIVFCMAPAIGLLESRISDLVGGRVTVIGGRPAAVRSGLVVAQVALACCLAHIGAVASYTALRIARADLGFTPAGLLTVTIPTNVIPLREPERLKAAIESIEEDLGSISMLVSGVAFADSLPFGPGGFFRSVQLAEDRSAAPVFVKTSSVSANYFQTAGIPLKTGRTFEKGDAAMRAVLVNERLSNTLRPEGLIGSEILIAGLRHRVIGVVADIRDESPTTPPRPIVYTQADRGSAERILLVRISRRGDADQALTAVRHSIELRTGAPWQAFSVRDVEDAVSRSTALYRARSFLLALLAGIVVALTSVGIFTAVSSLVNARQHEIGVRLALGAAPSNVRYWLIGRVITLVGCGIALGIAAGVLSAHLARSLLFEMAPSDPLSIVSVVILFTCVAVGSAALPAFRASQFDPTQMLREQ